MKRPAKKSAAPASSSQLTSFEWKGPIEGYTHNFLARNYWKVARSMEYEDAVQEAYAIYLECVGRYSGRCDNAKWFMSLYKLVLSTRFTDFAKRDTRSRAIVYEASRIETEEPTRHDADGVGDLDNAGYLNILIKEAPKEVREVLAIFLNAPSELLDLVFKSWKGKDDTKGTNAFLARLIGRKEDDQIIEQVVEYFS